MDEKVIIKKIQQGNRDALGLLWKSHSTNVLNLAFRMLKNRDEAEDVLMDIFVSVPGKIKNFRGESALNTWLYRLTVNECLMRLRSKKRHAELEEGHIDLLTTSAIGTKSSVQGTIIASGRVVGQMTSLLAAHLTVRNPKMNPQDRLPESPMKIFVLRSGFPYILKYRNAIKVPISPAISML